MLCRIVGRLAADERRPREVRRLARDAETLQTLLAVAFRHRVRHVYQRLRRLADRNGGDDLVGHGVDRGDRVGILEPDIDPAAVA